MTRKQALEECIELWSWIAEDPKNHTKLNPPQKFSGYRHICPCCEYAYRQSYRVGEKSYKDNCSLCPIEWGTEHVKPAYFCEVNKIDYKRANLPIGEPTPYVVYCVALEDDDMVAAREAALDIINLARKALEKETEK